VVEKIELHQCAIGEHRTYVHTIKAPVFDLRNEICGILGIYWYVQQRDQAIKFLREKREQSEQEGRIVFRNPNVGWYRSTPDGRFLAVNPALAAMLGYESPEAVCRGVMDIGNSFYADTSVRAAFLNSFKSKDKVVDFRCLIRPLGSASPIRVSEDAHAVKDAHGTVMFFEGTVRILTGND
jgi:PAS domain S-box-containing protein